MTQINPSTSRERAGRALVHAMLQHGGATPGATVPVSAGLLTDTGTYFVALGLLSQPVVTSALLQREIGLSQPAAAR